MSRALGNKSRMKQWYRDTTPEAKGRAMFADGKPCPPNSPDKGVAHALWRGWQRAATEARTKGKK